MIRFTCGLVILLLSLVMFNGCGLRQSEIITKDEIQSSLSQDEQDDEAKTGLTIESMAMVPGVAYDVYVFINDYDLETHELSFNVIEWIASEERADEIGINFESDMPKGFYIYDEIEVTEKLSLADDFTYMPLNETTPMTVDSELLYTFVDYMKKEEFNYPFCFRVLNGEITKVSQVVACQ